VKEKWNGKSKKAESIFKEEKFQSSMKQMMDSSDCKQCRDHRVRVFWLIGFVCLVLLSIR